MAIWQVHYIVVHRQAIKQRYGSVPDKLFVDEQEREHQLEQTWVGKGKYRPIDDALEFDWWKVFSVPAKPVVDRVDQILPRTKWNKSSDFIAWKGNVEASEDNDVWLGIDVKTGLISSFSIRIDLRDKTSRFLLEILQLFRDFKLLLLQGNGNLLLPRMDVVAEQLPASNAAKFLMDPEQFLQAIGDRIDAAKATDSLLQEVSTDIRKKIPWYRVILKRLLRQ